MPPKGKKTEKVIDDANTIRCPMCGKTLSLLNYYQSNSQIIMGVWCFVKNVFGIHMILILV